MVEILVLMDKRINAGILYYPGGPARALAIPNTKDKWEIVQYELKFAPGRSRIDIKLGAP